MPEETATPVAEFLSKVQQYNADADELIEAYSYTSALLKDMPGAPPEALVLAEKTVMTLAALKYLVNILTEHQLELDDLMENAIKDMNPEPKN